MYDSQDYLTHIILNNIEDNIEMLYNTYTAETYDKKIWQLNEYVFINDIKNIENGIDYLGSLFDYPNGWEPKREWGAFGRISYRDVNRWIKNLDILNELNPLVPREDLYPSETLVPTNKKESD